MRLLNTTKLKLEEFGGNEIPLYAILLHRWGQSEITFQDIKGNDAEKKVKYEKVRNTCDIAAANGFHYVWIDTCCIDKTSSAELSEAINSMYRWYQESRVCYAYLADVPSNAVDDEFAKSKWFTRGWTLQELIAPSTVIFLDQKWQKIGTKSSRQRIISEITGIPANILLGDDLERASVAQKMSWASKRETTRVEDIAYCLMGIFGINMPLIYGEGERAFIRLQEEIMKISDDHSLFAWKSKEKNHGGLLATSPDAFKESGNIVPFQPFNTSDSPLTISNRGIHLELRFIGIGHTGLGLAILNCAEIGKDSLVAIYLRDLFLTMKQFERDHSGKFKLLNPRNLTPSQCPIRRICVRQRRLAGLRKSEDDGKHMLKPTRIEEQNIALEKIHPHSNWKEFDGMTNLMDVSERTPLLHAPEGAHEKIIKLLMGQSDIETNLKDEDGQTLLLHAAGGGHKTVVKLLLARGDVEADSKDKDGRTALSHAAGGGHEAVVKLLLDRGDIETNSKDRDGRSPLSHAAGGGHKAVVWLLLTRNDVEADSKDKNGLTLLSHAARGGHEALMKILLARSDTEACLIDSMGRGPLSHAAERGHEALVELLLTRSDIQPDFKDKADLKDIEGRTPLSYAAENGHEAVVKLLLEKGAELETKDNKDGWTPLSYAAENGHEAVVKLLLEKGVELETKHYYGWTPLLYAARNGHEAVVKLLLKKGAELESKDSDSRTPLSFAAEEGHKVVVKLLLEKGAELESKDKDGLTPLSWATKNRHETVVKLLRSHDRLSS